MRRTMLAALLSATFASQVIACNAITDGAGSSCAQWASITGNVEQDRCPIAKADVDRAQTALAQLRDYRGPGAPIWSEAFVIAERDEARGRVARYCGNDAASLP